MMMKRTRLTDLREEMRAVARGERNPSPRPAAPLLAALSTEALELLGVLLRERPETIARVVELTGRAQPNVSRSLQQLALHGLVRLVKDGREVRPEPIARSFTVDLETGTYEAKPVTEAA
ncbi:helix-turn-helix domain-containing protein [Microvirga sp. 0TCS3.31]